MPDYTNQNSGLEGLARLLIAKGEETAGAKLQLGPNDGCGPQVPYLVLRDEDGSQQLVEASCLIRNVPDRIRAEATFLDLQAFIAYVQRFKNSTTVIMVQSTMTTATFTALLDYHNSIGYLPSPVTHRAVLKLTATPEWSTWLQAEGKEFAQLAFAQFLEENLIDILEPAGADMLEMAKTLEASQESEFKSRIVLENGDQQFTFDVKTSAQAGLNGQITIPTTFKLRIAPFLGMPRQDFECRFRYQLRRPSLVMGFVMLRKEQEIRRLVQASADIVHAETEFPVWEGSYKHC